MPNPKPTHCTRVGCPNDLNKTAIRVTTKYTRVYRRWNMDAGKPASKSDAFCADCSRQFLAWYTNYSDETFQQALEHIEQQFPSLPGWIKTKGDE